MGGGRLRQELAHEQCFTTPVSFIKDNNLYSLQTEWWCIMQMINKSSWGGNNNIRTFTQRCFLTLNIKATYKVVQNSSWEESSYKSPDSNQGRIYGESAGGAHPPPPEMICGFLTQLVFCKKKNYVVYWCWSRLSKRRVHPLLKKNPGSAPGNEWNKRNYFGKKNGKKECLLYISSFFTCSPY